MSRQRALLTILAAAIVLEDAEGRLWEAYGGYREVVEHLRGERGFRETIELVKTRTRQFSKRQGTWFRGQLDLQWLEVGRQETPAVTADRIVRQLEKGTDVGEMR